jgi:hypothetical protein
MDYKKATPKTARWWIGLWATVWWGVSGVYILLLAWEGREYYAIESSSIRSGGFFSDWWSAVTTTYDASNVLPALLALIIAVWIAGGVVWLRELKRQKISYKAAFKDLLLTIRR